MLRFLTVLTSVVALVALVVVPAIAQTQQPSPSAPARPAPGSPGAAAPSVEKPAMKEVEGTVKKIDAAAKSVQVSSGLLGLFGATLEVADDTQIQVEGKPGSLADLREGSRVKASYESRDGKNVAKSIEVLPAEEKDKAASPSGSPARPTPPMGTAPAPSAQPKTQ